VAKIDARRLAFDVLSRVEDGAYADLTLSAELDRNPDLERRERALATELVYGVLRRRGRLDFALSHCSRQPLRKLEPAVLTVLRLGAYQLLELDRVPVRAAVHATVELVRQLGLHRATGFVNGVLRGLDRDRARLPWPDPASAPGAYLEHVLSLPDWLGRHWLAEYGTGEALALAAAMADAAPFTLRVNTLRSDRQQLLALLETAGQEAATTTFAPEGIVLHRRGAEPLPAAMTGLFQVQDEASMLIAHLLAPAPGERLLDACAAPGGKTTHLAALANNQAEILALDLHPQRAALVAAGAERLGCRGIAVRSWDLTTSPDFIPPASLDGILIDAPCTGLGVLRRNPELRWRRSAADPARLARLQATILNTAAPLLRPGGRLVYSVCTLTPEETTGVVAEFLAGHPEFSQDDLRPVMPAPWAPLFDPTGALRTLPHRHGGMDAFYAVRLRKAEAGPGPGPE
jgi:16S rRNA (cytosine967-C5)-methyltransferase